MHGTLDVTKPAIIRSGGEAVKLTPGMATQLLEHNTLNRPLSDAHVRRIAKQIVEGKWRFNGDTIKIADTGDVLDGQHRLWAVIESKKTVDTILVTGIEKDAFSTIDTLRKPRSGGDVVALNGQARHRNIVASALAWLIRWQRGKTADGSSTILEKYKEPANRVENADIEKAFEAHQKGIGRAVERAMTLRKVGNPSLLAFIYYVTANQNAELAEHLVVSLDNPARLSQSHPFYQLRDYFVNRTARGTKDPLVTIALAFKALNAAHAKKEIRFLSWQSQGKRPEAFPTLSVMAKQPAKKEAA